jgi:hypothetical protein
MAGIGLEVVAKHQKSSFAPEGPHRGKNGHVPCAQVYKGAKKSEKSPKRVLGPLKGARVLG